MLPIVIATERKKGMWFVVHSGHVLAYQWERYGRALNEIIDVTLCRCTEYTDPEKMAILYIGLVVKKW